jgi:hypothetical protein
VVMIGWRGLAAADPIKNVSIGAVEQRLVTVELSLVKPGEMSVGKAAKNQVALSRPAVPGTEEQPLPTNFG